SVVATVLIIGTWVWIGVTNDQYSQLDRRLDSLSSLPDVNTLLSIARQSPTGTPQSEGSLVRTVRIGAATVSMPADIVLPQFDNGFENTTINGVEYRVRTVTTGTASIALGAPLAEAQSQIRTLHMRILAICSGVIVGTFLVGGSMWLVMI